MAKYFDRYSKFKDKNTFKPIPGITISLSNDDKMVLYKQTRTRLDKLSQEYYGNPYHGWLIMVANPQFGGLEFNIPDGEIIRIPFPFKDAIERYDKEVDRHILLYGK